MRRPPAGPVTTRWWWVRHAPTNAPSGVIPGPEAPADLSDRPALDRLVRRLPEPALWLTSGFLRAEQTRRALTHVPALVEPRFGEQDFGSWTGRSHDDLAREDSAYEDFWSDPAGRAPPGGESFSTQMGRVAAAVTALGATHAGLDVVVVAHAGTIRAALAHALDLTPGAALRLAIPPLSLTRVDRVGEGWRVGPVGVTP